MEMSDGGNYTTLDQSPENNPEEQLSGRRNYRLTAVCLGLLSVLLLTIITAISVHYTRVQNDTMEKYSTLSETLNQLQTNYSSLTAERDQLQTNYNSLTGERDQLQTNYNSLTGERDQLQTNYNSLTEERDQLQTNYKSLTAERDQLQTNYNSLTGERDQLQTNYKSLIAERDQLQTNYNNLTAERDQVQSSCRSVIAERDQLKTNYNSLMAERDQLQRTLVHSCSEGWLRLRSSFYYVSSERKTWSESRQYCREREADLVIINNKEEQIFLSVFYNTWIGLSDHEREGTWKWVDGTTLTTGYWRSGEPNNVGNEDCGAVHGGDNPETTWNDLPCSVETYWVCEKAAP